MPATKSAVRRTPLAPEYGAYNSYPLSQEQVKRAVQTFESDFMEDSREDDKAAVFLALLCSFTYTTDHSQREYMLFAAEAALMPSVGAASSALKRLSVKAHKSLVNDEAHGATKERVNR